MSMRSLSALLATAALAANAASAAPRVKKCLLDEGVTETMAVRTLCGFDAGRRQFAGTPAEQARCLTRHVGIHARIGDPELPDGLARLVESRLDLPAGAVERYVVSLGLGSGELGGPLTTPVAAQYFIIHDTSYPNCSKVEAGKAYCPRMDEFPPDRDKASWRANQTFEGRPRKAPNRIANAFTNRVGASVTEVDFAEQFYTTKFEQCESGAVAVGRFVGVENIQPRLTSPRPTPAGRKINDAEAPDPGFTAPQYERLALLYVVASARHGSWLIPAYHAVIDSYYDDKHDDPQKFAIAEFDRAIAAHVSKIRALTAH